MQDPSLQYFFLFFDEELSAVYISFNQNFTTWDTLKLQKKSKSLPYFLKIFDKELPAV